MADPADYTNPHLHTYRSVPVVGDGVCTVCHSGPNAGYDICQSCARTTGQVRHPTTQVVPISLYEVQSQLHYVLRKYKSERSSVTDRLTTQVAAMLACFLNRHEGCLTSLGGGEFTLVTNVPSTHSGRRGEHPLVGAIRLVRRLGTRYVPTLIATGLAIELSGRRQASDTLFAAIRRVDNERVLLIDDTFTSGSRVQSATSALFRAGAAAVTALTVGRVIDPNRNDSCRAIWEWAGTQRFTFDRCCLCG